MRLLALLRAAAVVVAVPSPLEPAAPSPCAGAGLLHTQCNTVANKVPAVTNGARFVPPSPACPGTAP